MSSFLKETVHTNGEDVEILIEVDEPLARGHLGGSTRSGPAESLSVPGGSEEMATHAFTKGMRLIRTCAEQVAKTVRQVSDTARPQEVEVKFGVKLNSQAGALIAKTSRLRIGGSRHFRSRRATDRASGP